MADLRKLDGTKLDAAPSVRNEGIAVLLGELAVENDAGRLSVLMAITISPEAAHCVRWELPEQDFGYPWGLALRGALVLGQGVLDRAMMCYEMPKPDEGP